jgi:hypothetical protein
VTHTDSREEQKTPLTLFVDTLTKAGFMLNASVLISPDLMIRLGVMAHLYPKTGADYEVQELIFTGRHLIGYVLMNTIQTVERIMKVICRVFPQTSMFR